LITLLQGSPDIDFIYQHSRDGEAVELDTRELKEQLGDVPVNAPEVLAWIREYLEEQYTSIK
ncbi:MAG: ATP-binding protein, partial [Clostridia bacterium]|nr:ATP-binding protein [Clostridia bacterium]